MDESPDTPDRFFRAGRKLLHPSCRLLLTLLCMNCLCAQALAALVPLADQDLSSLSAQGLLESDKIVATSITGTPGVDSNLTFYRMGLNVDLALNANFNRMQLGCGGVNNGLIVGCDIDLSNVGFLGIGTNNQGCPVGSSGSSCPHGGDFILHRPYFELAIANDNTPQRQVAGFNFGAETATGLISVGRNYTSGTNLETGATCNSASSSAAQCQSGINMISGYVRPTLFGYIEGPLKACVIVCIPLGNYYACLSNANSNCPKSGYNNNASDTGTNGTSASAIQCTRCVNAEMSALANGSALGGISFTATAHIFEAMSFLHQIALDGVPNFGFSFQRQQVAYPTYDKTSWNAATNTGWWLNAPSNVNVNVISTSGPSLEAIGTLVTGSATLNNVNLYQAPVSNCMGSYKFC